MNIERLDVDLLVLGAGMSGITAATCAAQHGLRVLVLEKSHSTGGSAKLAEGYVWTAPDLATLIKEDPHIDLTLGQALVERLPHELRRLRELGVETQHGLSDILGFGTGSQIDVHSYFDRCERIIRSYDGFIIPDTTPLELLDDEARVTGARVSNSEGETYVDADNVLLATGGFQGDPALRVRYIHPAADRLLLRANPCSAGDGLRLALDIGASHSDNMSSFYGCLMPYPLTRELSQTDYTALAQYHSEHAVLINRAGRRFCDESLGDRVSAGAVLRQPGATALLLADEELKSRYILQAFIPGMDRGMDKFELARTLGAHLVSAPTLPELAYQVGQWGFNAERLLMTISRYNDDLINGTPGHPRRSRHAMRLTTPPFFALEVQPAITMTYGGVRVDGHCRALTREGAVIKGLYAIGFDAGGFYQRGYAGGLARALVTGAIAVEHILSLPREVTHA